MSSRDTGGAWKRKAEETVPMQEPRCHPFEALPRVDGSFPENCLQLHVATAQKSRP